MPRKRPTYHHGDLRAALIKASDEIIAEDGIEGFSLRAAAKRAGVSPGAPAHHFGSAKGLLTEVALLAYQKVDQYLEEAGRSDDVVKDVRAVSLAFVTFAFEHPGHFRLMFRNDLVDRNDPRYPEISHKPGKRISHAITAYYGKSEADQDRFEDAADLFCGLSTLHGLASLMLAEKFSHLFNNPTPQHFLKRDLPKILERLYPDQKRQSQKNRLRL